jgi:NitT/TauT family transport system permease protein
MWLKLARMVGPIALLLVIWELLPRLTGLPPYILPAPTQILARTVESRQTLLVNAGYSFGAILCGYGTAIATGLLLAIAVAYSRWIEGLTQPFIVISQVVPKVALAPLFLIWFGHGLFPKIVIVTSIAFFPILVNAVLGLKSVETEIVELMDSIAATKRQIFWKVRLPNALPYIFPALKVAALLSIVGEMVGEFVASDRGLGYVMIIADTDIQTDLLFAAILAVTAIGLLMYGTVGLAERLVLVRFGDGSAPQLVAL